MPQRSKGPLEVKKRPRARLGFAEKKNIFHQSLPPLLRIYRRIYRQNQIPGLQR